MTRAFLVKCPNCKKDMKYVENLNSPSKSSDISKKSKRCVFCGKTFKVKNRIIKEIL